MKFTVDNPDHVNKFQVVDCMGRPVKFVRSFDTETCEAEMVMAQPNHDGTHSVVMVQDEHGAPQMLVAKVILSGAEIRPLAS